MNRDEVIRVAQGAVTRTGPTVLILMGVAASGKTTVGRLLAESLGWPFYDADNFHPPANVEKMRQGIPLTNEDRLPWLERLGELVAGCLSRNENAVLACSALRESYRRTLSGGDPRVRFIHLRADPDVLAARLEHRKSHFFARSLLESQLASLEVPRDAIAVDASRSPEEIVRKIRESV